MAGPVYQAPLSRIWGDTLALTTSRASIQLPPAFYYVGVYTSSATDFRLGLGVAVKGVFFYDASEAAGSKWKNISAAMLDKTTTGSGTTLDSASTSDRLYVNLNEPNLGLWINVVGASPNANAAVMTCNYRKNNDTWATTSATDGTIVAVGKSLGQDGEVSFTKPTDWKSAYMGGPNDPITTDIDAPVMEGFWLQMLWDAALDSDTEIEDIWGLPVDTNYGYFSGAVHYIIPVDRRSVGAIAALLASGTDTLNLDYLKAVQ